MREVLLIAKFIVINVLYNLV
uniref:Uncharacterized protein n=1 Tax=Anguilla anguilla TaxID=7936 RepID=A0A0E9TCB3_ANGAN